MGYCKNCGDDECDLRTIDAYCSYFGINRDDAIAICKKSDEMKTIGEEICEECFHDIATKVGLKRYNVKLTERVTRLYLVDVYSRNEEQVVETAQNVCDRDPEEHTYEYNSTYENNSEVKEIKI